MGRRGSESCDEVELVLRSRATISRRRCRRQCNQLPIKLLLSLPLMLLLQLENCGDPRAQAGAAAHERKRESRTVSLAAKQETKT